jgi:hypothetical protein
MTMMKEKLSVETMKLKAVCHYEYFNYNNFMFKDRFNSGDACYCSVQDIFILLSPI